MNGSQLIWLLLPVLRLLLHPLGGPAVLAIVVCLVVRWRSKHQRLRSLATFGLAASLALAVWSGIQVVRSAGPGGDGVLARVVTTEGVECVVTQRWNDWAEPYTVEFFSRDRDGDWGWCYIDHESDRWWSCELVEDGDTGAVRLLERGRLRAEYDPRQQTFSLCDAAGRVRHTLDAPQDRRDPPTF